MVQPRRSRARAFSGTATYRCSVDLNALDSSTCVMLDLGRVAVIAAVTVNGHTVTTLWGPPFRTDITPQLKPGAN